MTLAAGVGGAAAVWWSGGYVVSKRKTWEIWFWLPKQVTKLWSGGLVVSKSQREKHKESDLGRWSRRPRRGLLKNIMNMILAAEAAELEQQRCGGCSGCWAGLSTKIML